MSDSSSCAEVCPLCGEREVPFSESTQGLCSQCHDRAEALFDCEMRRVELIRTIRGRDVELYDVKHPDSSADLGHCGQVILIRAGRGFEVKVCLRSKALDWMSPLTEDDTGFISQDTRLDALIGNVSLLIESWGGGPYYMDIFDVDRVISTEGEI